MKTIAVYEGRTLAVGENDKICHWLRATGAPLFAQQQTHPLSFRSRHYRRGICLLPVATQQIPRANRPRFGMTSLWGLSNYTNTDIARTMIQADFSIH